MKLTVFNKNGVRADNSDFFGGYAAWSAQTDRALEPTWRFILTIGDGVTGMHVIQGDKFLQLSTTEELVHDSTWHRAYFRHRRPRVRFVDSMNIFVAKLIIFLLI